MTGWGYIGGLVGSNTGGSIVASHATEAVTGRGGNVGGLVGLNEGGGTIRASFATGAVECVQVGGLVGTNASNILACYATGAVTAGGLHSRDTGGLVGSNRHRVVASYATGAVTGAQHVGGLVGANDGSIVASYATGRVGGAQYTGGMLGRNYSGGRIIDCYWDIPTSGTTNSAGGTGKTTVELQTPTGYSGLYTGWNLDVDDADGDGTLTTGGDEPWDFGAGSDYPALRADIDADGTATWQEFGSQRNGARLKALRVSPVDIAGFSAYVPSYHIGVAHEVSQAKVTLYLSDEGATIDIDGSSVVSGSVHAISLSEGRNDVTITVAADDGRTTRVYTVTVGRSDTTAYGWIAVADFNTLNAADNDYPTGLWADSTTIWVSDLADDNLYAYKRSTRNRDPEKDFDTLAPAGNTSPRGMWSDGETMWIADPDDDKIYAYSVATKARDASKDFSSLSTSSGGNRTLSGIWSDGATMWVVVDRGVHVTSDDKVYAYDMATKARDSSRDFTGLDAAGNKEPSGIWSDGTTMWVANYEQRSFNDANERIRHYSSKIYAYNMPPRSDVALPGAPTIQSVTPGEGLLTVTWSAPSSDGGSAIIAYDLRYNRSEGSTGEGLSGGMVHDIWTTGSGALSYELSLPEGTQWDLEVRAVNARGDGPWSAAVSGTTLAARAATDFNGDGRTDFADFFLFIDAYGGTDPRFDLDGNGTVDFADFFQFIDAFDPPGQAKLLALAQEMLGLPSETELQQNWPNPFNSETVISWFLLEPGPMQRLAVLRKGPQEAGHQRLQWDGRDDRGHPLASGVYLYRLVSGKILTRKLTLLR